MASAPSRLLRVVLLGDPASAWFSETREILLRTGKFEVTSKLADVLPPDLVIPLLTSAEDPIRVLTELSAAAPGARLLPVISEANIPILLDRPVPQVTDFLVGPVREAEVLARINRLFPVNPSQETSCVRDRLAEALAIRRLRGADPVLERVKRQILLVAKTDITVLVTGETGTGKELVAQAIHYLSDRADQPFLPVNCAAIPGDLFENELFGHQRGAFTDARDHQPGLVAEAEGGTLFLDELNALAPSAQAKLLRFMEDRSYRPLGSSCSLRANVRVLAATNVDLRQLVRAGTLREDLFYRFNVVPLHVPPLRERGTDVVLLAEYFLRLYGQDDARWGFSPRTLDALRRYAWPGNVRELQNVLQHAVLMNSPKLIEPEDLPIPDQGETASPGDGSLRAAKLQTIAEFECRYLQKMLQAHRGNITQAAKASGQDRRTFRRLIKKHGLERSVYASAP
jgi:two-component system response regulator GlrR